MPQIVSSGPDMPVFFRTSPFLAPKVSPYSLNGFELVVDIKFDEIESESYVPILVKSQILHLLSKMRNSSFEPYDQLNIQFV